MSERYDSGYITAIRKDMIDLRDARLNEADFGSAVVLSHAIAVLQQYVDDLSRSPATQH